MDHPGPDGGADRSRRAARRTATAGRRLAPPLSAVRPPLRISVVIPVKNDADALRRCLDSLSQQTLVPDEIVVVDNGSSDGSALVAREAGVVIVREDQPGIPAAASRGYDATTGDVIARLDADCIPGASWIEAIECAFHRDPSLAAISGGAVFNDGPVRFRVIGARLYLVPYYVLLALALGHTPLFGSNCAVRKTCWDRIRDKVHRGDQLMHDDIDLSYHLGPIAKIRYEPRLPMSISSRPLRDGNGRLRVRRGMHSILTHWPHDLPWLRLFRRLLSRRPGRRVSTLEWRCGSERA